MIFQITAPHFTAGGVIEDKKAARRAAKQVIKQIKAKYPGKRKTALT